MNRLRAYRDIESISQDELSKILGISAQMVSAVESGKRQFSGSLDCIGYSNSRFTLPDMSAPLHRHRASTTATAKKRSQELLRLAGEVFIELRSRTERTPDNVLSRQPTPDTSSDLEELATDIRYMLGIDDSGPIQNLTSAAERAGICLIPIVGMPGIFGLSSWVNGTPVVGISPTVSGDMFRFTLVHEIAHLIYHAKIGEHTESQANRLAGAVLFPLADFDAAMTERPQLRDFVALKSSWGMSVSAIVYRAHELEYIDDRRYRALQIQMAKWRRNEPGSFQPVHGALLGRLVEVNGGVGRVAEELGVSHRHLAELVNWSHLRLAS
jgi:Zn-dependent peptidase ImmA (M78 family)